MGAPNTYGEPEEKPKANPPVENQPETQPETEAGGEEHTCKCKSNSKI